MMKTFQEWMDEGVIQTKYFKRTKWLEMNDGTRMSIQASESHYCEPGENLDSYKDYESFEIGFPSKEFPILKAYADDEDNLTYTVYACVPVDVINLVITECGGVKGHGEKS